MVDIHRDPITRNYDVPISVNEWEEILQLPQVKNDSNILSALGKWYLAPNYIASCKSLGKQYGYSHNFFSIQNMRLGKIAVNYINRFRLIGENGKETYCPSPIKLGSPNSLYLCFS